MCYIQSNLCGSPSNPSYIHVKQKHQVPQAIKVNGKRLAEDEIAVSQNLSLG